MWVYYSLLPASDNCNYRAIYDLYQLPSMKQGHREIFPMALRSIQTASWLWREGVAW